MAGQPLKALWNEFVYGSHLLSTAAACICILSYQILQIEIDWWSLVIPYSMMQIIYKFNYIIETDDYETNPERAAHIKKKRRNFILQIVLFSTAFIASLIYYWNLWLFIFCIVYIIGGLWYPKQITKYVVAFKNIYVTFFWAILPLIPVLIYHQPISRMIISLVGFIFFRVLVNAIFADFKDVKTDKEQGYKTLPAYMGIRPAIYVLQAINLLSFGVLIWAIVNQLFPTTAWALLIFMPYNVYYIQTANQQSAKNIRLISYVLVDGEYILWPLVIAVATYFA